MFGDSMRIETEPKRVFVNRLFTTIAPRYDWFNRLATLGLDVRWRAQVVRQSGVREGMVVLDVCTGTGDFAFLCARHLQGRSVVVGLDANEAMLRRAQQKPASTRLGIRWLRGDALALPFGASTVDRVLIGFSTRNLSDLSAGLREMHRVLKPDGRLLILETGHPSHPCVRWGYFAMLFTMTRLIGWLITGKVWPFTYLAQSVKGFLPPAECVALLTRCGFAAGYQPLCWGAASVYVAEKRETT
jgi:demethylmenaquinone methyltransferase/2-methoxy-6-polyprenyl-1,4-benzoquinol methylase